MSTAESGPRPEQREKIDTLDQAFAATVQMEYVAAPNPVNADQLEAVWSRVPQEVFEEFAERKTQSIHALGRGAADVMKIIGSSRAALASLEQAAHHVHEGLPGSMADNEVTFEPVRNTILEAREQRLASYVLTQGAIAEYEQVLDAEETLQRIWLYTEAHTAEPPAAADTPQHRIRREKRPGDSTITHDMGELLLSYENRGKTLTTFEIGWHIFKTAPQPFGLAEQEVRREMRKRIQIYLGKYERREGKPAVELERRFEEAGVVLQRGKRKRYNPRTNEAEGTAQEIVRVVPVDQAEVLEDEVYEDVIDFGWRTVIPSTPN